MVTEYRVIFTATFDTEAERDKAYETLKTTIGASVSKAAMYKRADMTKDQYAIPTAEDALLLERVLPVSEKVI